MEKYKNQLLNILNSAINGTKYNGSTEMDLEWDKIIKEADKHDISSLLYYSINKDLKKNDFSIFNNLKVNVLKSSIIQIDYFNCAKELILRLQEKGAQIIVLKGFILKSLYPRPEFRTMGDLDILIHMKDYDIVKEYLTSIGYNLEKGKSTIHSLFYKENEIDVEVHWKLINNDNYSGDEKEFEENIWRNSKEFNIYGLKVRTLGDEDFLIHICMHMAVHARGTGFGLRQLCDLALFTKNKYENIDWISFKKRINRYGILTFTEGLYALCDKLFKIKVPGFELQNTKLKEEHINLLLENIIYLGVNEDGKESKYYEYAYEQRSFMNKVKQIIQIVFENRVEISTRYKYVKKHFYLLPIAWIQRIFKAVKKYGVIKIFKCTKHAIEVKEKKNQIANVFNL